MTSEISKNIPVVETERLILRGHELRDFVNSAEMWADPKVTRFIGGTPLSESEAWGKVLRFAGLWSFLGFGYWVVEEKGTGKFVGEVGFADFKREIDPPLTDPELGWVLSSRFHGQGFATEAVRAAIAWGDANLRAKRTVSIIDPENVASIRVAEKGGFREVLRTTYVGHATIVFERLRHP